MGSTDAIRRVSSLGRSSTELVAGARVTLLVFDEQLANPKLPVGGFGVAADPGSGGRVVVAGGVGAVVCAATGFAVAAERTLTAAR
jgi:hypothetical protein